MKSGFLTLLLFLFLFNQTLSGQEQADTAKSTKFKHALGFGAGFTTGYGLSYRFIPKKFGVQANFAPYKDSYNTSLSIGITFLYKLIETRFTNFFLYQGNHYFYHKEKYYYDNPESYEVNKFFSNGLGVGIEFIILKRLSFNLMGGYSVRDNFNKINFTGETGLYFRF
ncbi:MAG: hypothetical protein IQL11_11200 [Bacteroidales bacterium]|nr:hypothetical protein [Bacteroidales bacterium]